MVSAQGTCQEPQHRVPLHSLSTLCSETEKNPEMQAMQSSPVSGREQVTRWREWLWIGLLIDFVLEAWLFEAFCYSH